MKKQNEIIHDMEDRTEALGGTIRVQRYEYIREAIVEVEFGECHMMVSIGPRGAIKYCSWFLVDGPLWSVHHDEKCFTGKRNAQEVEWFFTQVGNCKVREAA